MRMRVNKLFTLLMTFGLLVGLGSVAHAQVNDPSRIGAGQLPYVVIVLDTSGSTEWTDVGDERYPESAPIAIPPGPNEWQPGTPMQLDPAFPLAGPARFGPCMVWEQDWDTSLDPNECDNYVRPTWNVDSNVPGAWDYPTVGPIASRFTAMRGTDLGLKIRLNPESQPRHITLKEVLTGDMYLRPIDRPNVPVTSMDPITEGPGCWFVPRQRFATVQPSEDQTYCEGANEFEDLPDFNEPRPHFQEVFEAQASNGVLDKLSGQAIFAVAQLDGYKDDVSGWQNGLNDNISGNVPPPLGVRGGSNEDSAGGYDLGVYRITGPDDLEIPSSYLNQLSAYTQIALVDSGWLHEDDDDDFQIDIKKNQPPGLGVTFDKQFDKYVNGDYKLGKQPIARATPLAAAVMDIHQHLLEDNIVTNDPYEDCRPKQVVLVTDGYPEPERPGGAGGGIGSNALSPAFDYDPSLYYYDIAENEIDALVTNTSIAPGSFDRKFSPRVHVVGLSVGGNPAQQAQIVDKLSAMAIAGNTCAGAFVSNTLRQEAPYNCDPNTTVCLVDGQNTFSYTHPDPNINGGNPINCRYPALILTQNDRNAIEQALFQVLSGIISGAGISSRTRAVVSNRLDDDTLTAGGQYRVYSGVRTDGSSYWRGIINRQLIPCDDTASRAYSSSDSAAGAGIDSSGVLIRRLHEDVASQVVCNAVNNQCVNPTDNRRIFTSIPTDEIYDYTTDQHRVDFSGDPNHPLFHFVYHTTTLTGTKDTFQEVNVPNAANVNLLNGSRIPLLPAELKDAVLTASSAATWGDTEVSTYFGLGGDPLTLDDDLEELTNVYRGRIFEKSGVPLDEARVFAGLVNSNPIVVGPPDLDIPVESYRSFRARYGDRPTMLYTATLDGLIHALHLGTLEDRVAVRSQAVTSAIGTDENSATLSAEDQREAWAYMPSFLLRRLSVNLVSQPSFMDGNPVVKDVKLCQRAAGYNQNRQACRVANSSSQLADDQIWRTVMVVGMGSAGDGYVALDITRSGGLAAGGASRDIDRPDPAVLWEFDRNWERVQLEQLTADGEEDRVRPVQVGLGNHNDGLCGSNGEFWRQPLLGTSISDPEIGTILVEYPIAGNPTTQQRPVAIFGGGFDLEGVTGCGAAGMGSAIYVVDLQTGSIIRRFTEYQDGSGNWHSFANADDYGRFGRAKFTGSPVLYDNFTGSVASRGFIGDNVGRLYRMDFTKPNPADWEVNLFFDPYESSASDGMQSAADSLLPGSDNNYGPAAYKPAVSLAPDRSLVVTYGLGEVGDTTTGGQAQAVVTLNENLATKEGDLLWYLTMEEGEKLTGQPIIFNSGVYFPTYAVPNADVCLPGFARIYGLHYYENGGLDSPVGLFDPMDPQLSGPDIDVDANGYWFGPSSETLIRGLTITLGPSCSARGLGTDLDTDGLEGADAQPQLIAQTGGVPAGALENKFGGDVAGSDAIGRLVADLPKPRSMTVPLSWSVVSN